MTDPFSTPKDGPVLPSSHTYPYASSHGIDSIGSGREAEITRLRARVEELEAALKQAGQWFHEYGVGHHAKGAKEKAERNIERSQFCVSAATKGTAHDPR